MKHDIYQTYRKSGVPPAIEKFAAMIQVGVEREPLIAVFDPRTGPRAAKNVMCWFELNAPAAALVEPQTGQEIT